MPRRGWQIEALTTALDHLHRAIDHLDCKERKAYYTAMDDAADQIRILSNAAKPKPKRAKR